MSQGNVGKKGWINRGLNLRAKSFLGILLTITSVFLVIALIVDPIITDAFSRDEKIDTEAKVQQAMAAFTSEITDLGGITRDWASWDDTYAFAADGNSAYIKSNLNANSFTNNRLNLIAIFDAAGKSVWGNTYDLTQPGPAAAPEALFDFLARINLENGQEKTGLIVLGSEWWMVAAAPILTSEGTGLSHGKLIFGRRLDDVEIEHLRKVSRLLINLYPAADPRIPTEVLKTAVFTRPLGESTIRGYSVLSDIDGKPSLVIAVDVPRTIYLGGQNTLRYFNLSLILVTVMYSIIAMLFLEALVISRISNLSRTVSRIGWNGDEQRVAVKGNDDVSVLGRAINTMLDKLDESRKTLELREKRFRLLADNAQDLIYRISLSPELKIDYVSPSAESMTGYTLGELYNDPGELGFKLIPADDMVLLQTMVISPDAYLRPVQVRLIKKDGSVIWTEQKNTPFYTAGKLVAVEGIARDITERKQAETALRESEEKYRTLVENLPVGIAINTFDGRPIERNRASMEMHGYTSFEEFSKVPPISLYIDLEDRNRFLEALKRGMVRNFETRHKRKDGSTFWISMTAIPQTSENGEKQILVVSQDIDERKKVEEALRTSEERYHSLVEEMPVGLSITTDDKFAIDRNKAWLKMYGFDSWEEAIRTPVTEHYVYPEDRQRLLRFRAIGIVKDFEMVQKKRDGTLFWVSVTCIPRETPSGRQYINVVQDITERKHAANTLKASEEKFRNLVENAPIGIAIMEADGQFALRNKYLQEMYGFHSREEMDKVLVADHYYNPEDRKRYLELAKEGPVRDFEVLLKRKDGSLLWGLMNSIPNTGNESKQLITVVQDITARKLAERQLELESRLLDAATDSIMLREINDGVPGKPVYANKAAYVSRGYTHDEFMELPLTSIVSEPTASIESRIAEILRKGENTYEIVQKKKDGSPMPVEVHARLITLEGKTYLLSVVRDITERKKAEEERDWLFQNEIALRKELENEIQKRAEFTRALVHELKTPLTPVMASSDLLVEELREEPFLSLAKNINRGAVNLNNRIDELLDLARGEIGMLHLNLKPVDTAQLMHDVFDYTAPSAMENGEAISLEIPDFLPEITADEERLRQVLLNLIGNAVKYTNPGGKIWLSAGVEGDNLVFHVKDTGHGIDEDEKKQLFQPYHRFDADREHLSGLGLGLSLAKRLIELHKGKIWVESKKDVGSTFSFSIPIKSEAGDRSKPPEP